MEESSIAKIRGQRELTAGERDTIAPNKKKISLLQLCVPPESSGGVSIERQFLPTKEKRNEEWFPSGGGLIRSEDTS